MLSKKIRKEFLQYFAQKGHKILPSSPVLPENDPTLLFVNAGMNQFKDVFLGKSSIDYPSVTTSQKCIRVGGKHNDLENVGHTSRHITFFEMLGNFSFGSYFKELAIEYAWDVSTNIFGFDPAFLWATVFEKDDESFELWKKYLPEKKIVRMGEKDNFWSMGDVGPCGPCSEILYDRGASYSKAKSPLEDTTGERYLEFWNLVFMEQDRINSEKIVPLPKKCIDTGAGLERVISLILQKDTVFQTDILGALIEEISDIFSIKYQPNTIQAPAFHVLSDHIRTLSFAIADGVYPSNVDRGYILRKILRRAVRYGKTLNINKPFLSKLVPLLISLMGEDFPEIIHAKNQICEVIEKEEFAFLRTLEKGGNIFQTIVTRSEKIISGKDAFKLKDTYGLPLEEILLIAKDAHKTVDLHTYEMLEKQAKELSRASRKGVQNKFSSSAYAEFATQKTLFVGYEKSEITTQILALFFEDSQVEILQEGQSGVILLPKTPFYAEMGGQVGDKGTIESSSFCFVVTNCIYILPHVVAHIGYVEKGTIQPPCECHAQIDVERRSNIAKNHSATHLLHYALQHFLGSHIRQAGSLVEDIRLRFDFSHHEALSNHQLREMELLINEIIRKNYKVKTFEIPYSEAQKNEDIVQIFGEKYQDIVRVVDMEISKELCAGTHVQQLGEIGFCKIMKESSIAAGVRRIEMCSGKYAENFVYDKEDLIDSIGHTLHTPFTKILEKIDSLIEDKNKFSDIIAKYSEKERKQEVVKALSQVETINSIAFIGWETSIDKNKLKDLAHEIMQELRSGILAIAIKQEDTCQFLIQVSPDLVEKKICANTLIKQISPIIEGGGGGKPLLAQAGGKKPTQIPQALNKMRKILEEL